MRKQKTRRFLLTVILSCLMSFPALAQDPFLDFLTGEKEEESSMNVEDRFAEYVQLVSVERMAFKDSLSALTGFLESLENGQVRRSDFNSLKKQVSEVRSLLEQNEITLSLKSDDIFDSFQTCSEPSPDETG